MLRERNGRYVYVYSCIVLLLVSAIAKRPFLRARPGSGSGLGDPANERNVETAFQWEFRSE
eukprot:4371182-Prymnesium_polylepis.1